jgi:uncharacterized protein YlxW (UPF0749 family)
MSDHGLEVSPAGGPAPVEPRPRKGLHSLLRPKLRRVDLLIAALLAALGFAAAVQVRSTQDDGVLASARQEDLVRILDDLSGRSDRLRQEITTLTGARERLAGAGGSEAALEEARRRTQVLGILTGTAPATGPGITLTVDDPAGVVEASILLDALEELRDAGAEAVQLEGTAEPAARVRVIASTSLIDDPAGRGILVDGALLRPGYRFVVLGDPGTLASAMGIPGGVLDTIEGVGGEARVERGQRLQVDVLRQPEVPRYARPAPG